ncbi:hypothetical protein [Croceicoccus bisphenolivorans]|uniref:hypothetical protein n=1 Tax=Croceicoccus bisphenolivorans TaxID=1783232 RepID=UPI0012E7B741|nr:hypothetical protein [Croceicoccus bisphenolivorans]
MNRNDNEPASPAPRPGFDPARAWSEATAMLKANKAILPVLAGLFFLVPQVLMTALLPDVPANLEGEAATEAALEIFAAWWPLVLAMALLQATGMLAIIVLLADRARPTVAEALRKAAKSLPVYIAATLVLVAGVGLTALLIAMPLAMIGGESGAAVAIVPIIAAGLWVNVRTLVLAPVIAAEREGNPFDALKRSWAMTTGRSARILFFVMMFVLAALVVSVVTTAVPGAILVTTLGQETGRAIVGLIEGFVSAAVMLAWTALIVAIYRQLAR